MENHEGVWRIGCDSRSEVKLLLLTVHIYIYTIRFQTNLLDRREGIVKMSLSIDEFNLYDSINYYRSSQGYFISGLIYLFTFALTGDVNSIADIRIDNEL